MKIHVIVAMVVAAAMQFPAQAQTQTTIFFDSAGGTAVAPITGEVGAPVSPPPDPTREGYTFAGWIPAIPATFPEFDLTVVAQWEAIPNPTSTITFDSDGGTPIAPITQDEGTAVTAPADPTRAGYTFQGWVPAVPATMPVDDLTCVAQWQAVITYDLTIESAYGSTLPAVGVHEVSEGAEVTVQAISPDTRGTTQYVCTGWAATESLDPAGGLGTQAVVTVNGDGTLTWLWRTEYWLDPTAGPHGAVDRIGGWFTNNEPVSVEALPDLYYHFTNWTGDVAGGAEQDNPLNLVMDGPKAVMAHFAEDWTTNKPTPHWWLGQFGITSRFEEAVLEDPDNDTIPTGDEHVMNTDPTNQASFLHVERIGNVLGTNCYDVISTNAEPPYEVVTQIVCDVIGRTLTWPSATDRVYEVQSCILFPGGTWSAMEGLTNLTPSATSITTTNAPSPEGAKLYRVGVRIP